MRSAFLVLFSLLALGIEARVTTINCNPSFYIEGFEMTISLTNEVERAEIELPVINETSAETVATVSLNERKLGYAYSEDNLDRLISGESGLLLKPIAGTDLSDYSVKFFLRSSYQLQKTSKSKYALRENAASGQKNDFDCVTK